MPTATVALTDVPAFCAQFGVRLYVTASQPDGLWYPEAHQTPAQAQAWREYLAAGAGRWEPAVAQRVGDEAQPAGAERKPIPHRA